MITFIGLFLCLCIYGLLTGHLGGALICLGVIGLCLHAKKVFAAQDKAYNESPKRATTPSDTLALLDQKGCEASVDKLPSQISKSDSEI